MATTPVYGLRYRLLTDTPDIAAGTQNLAEDIEADLQVTDGLVSKINAREGAGAGLNTAAGAGTLTTTAAYANMASPSSVPFTKQETATRLKVEFHVTAISSAINTMAMFGVLIAGTDYDVAKLISRGTAGITEQAGGVRYVPGGIAAGVLTVQARWKRTFGTGTITIDANDWLSISVQEVL